MSRQPSSPTISMSSRADVLPRSSRPMRKRTVRPEPSRRGPLGLPVLLVADRARGGQRRGVVLEGAAQRLLCTEAGEGQVQHRLAHLASQPLALMRHAPATSRSRRSARHGSARQPGPACRRASRPRDAAPVNVHLSGDQFARCRHIHCAASRARCCGSTSVHGKKNGIVPGSWMPASTSSTKSANSSSRSRRSSRRGVRTTRSNRGQNLARSFPGHGLSPRAGRRRTRRAGRRPPRPGWPSP